MVRSQSYRPSFVVWFGWLAIFLVFELSGYSRRTPWLTLSETCWRLEDDSKPFTAALLFFLAGLLVHLIGRWPPQGRTA